MRKRKILLLYPYYWPHYKAGGPVQSLYNLVGFFSQDIEFYLISLDLDIDGTSPQKELIKKTWVKGPHGENIYYTSSFSFLFLWRRIKEVKPDIIFINGLFNAVTTLSGLIAGKLLKHSLAISPRGMLQDWALRRSPKIKRAFIAVLKLMLAKDELWHATDEQEKQDIFKYFGDRQRVNIASNIPRGVSDACTIGFPTDGKKIRLVFLSLINPNKNLHVVIDQVNKLADRFSLDIYGPAIDLNYWKTCQARIQNGSEVVYKGPVEPWHVPDVLRGYHFFVLPTQGENFGHAIFDALSCGVPVIISKKTPWMDIEESKSGFYIELEDESSIANLFKRISEISPSEYSVLRTQSLQYAHTYFKKRDFYNEYKFLIA